MTLEDHPRTGLDHLTDALSVTSHVARQHALWQAVGLARAAFTRDFATTALTGLPMRSDLSVEQVDRAHRARASTAQDVFLALQRALPTAVHTLTAITRSTPSPVHGSERLGLSMSIRRPLISVGYDLDEQLTRRLTYTAADCFARAMALPAPAAVVEMRLGARPMSDGPTLDHDLYDWRTGEPLHPEACMAALQALAAVRAAVLSGAQLVAA